MSDAYQIADQFCELIKATNLVNYLRLDTASNQDEVQKALKDRHTYLQSVQDLPQYRKEAAVFIKHFATFKDLLKDPDEYLRENARKKVFKHIPELKRGISEVLETGAITTEGVSYLRRLALDLGITMDVFEETLDQMCTASGIERPKGGEISMSAPVGDFSSENLYKVLGTSRHSNLEGLQEAYAVNLTAARNLGDPVASLQAISAVEQAWKTLSNPELRASYDSDAVTYSATAPTAPIRTTRKLEPRRRKPEAPQSADPLKLRPRRVGVTAPTAPTTQPIVGRKRAQNILVTLASDADIKLIAKTITVIVNIEKTDEKPLFARVSTDKGWLVSEQNELDESAKKQTVRLRINPAEVFNKREVGRFILQLETGEKISTPIDVEKISWWSPMTNIPAFIGTVFLMGIALFLIGNTFFKTVNAEGLNVVVDPTSEVVLINGTKVGSGSFVHYPNPPVGDLQITVLQSNFTPHRGTVTIGADEQKDVIVRLKLSSEMSFRPTTEMKRDNTIQTEEIYGLLPIENMNRCLDLQSVTGTGETRVVIYLGENGKARGVELDGIAATDSVVKECLTRHAATVVYRPLVGGDYAVFAVVLGEASP